MWEPEREVAEAAAREASAEIARFYATADAGVYVKSDASPVTDADIASDRIIRATITAAFPADALLTEEGADDHGRLAIRRCWIADPLDGTQQFIDRTGEFDVFVALTVDGVPVVAVACHPPSGLLLGAVAGGGAWLEDDRGRRPLRLPAAPVDSRPRLSTNRYHTQPEEWRLLREIARLAEMTPPLAPAAFHPRAFFDLPTGAAAFEAHLGLGPGPDGGAIGGEWDLAAPDLILREAGGMLTGLHGERLRYNRADPAVRYGVIAAADPAVHARLVEAVATVGR